jgi:hypothetical protein
MWHRRTLDCGASPAHCVDFKMGPYFSPGRRGTPGVQVDLIVRERPSQHLLDQAYFYRIIEARDYLKDMT